MDIDNISLSKIYRRKKNDRDIFQELMPTKVKEVLLVATLYDSYSIVREGQFNNKIYGEYLQLNLYSAPRFISVNTKEEALRITQDRKFDLIIVMVGMEKEIPVQTAKELSQLCPDIPLLLLVNNNADLTYFQAEARKIDFVDRVFVWNGNSNVFLAMIKYIEDKQNVLPDTEIGNVRVILLVEDSIQYYSRYLPILYTTIMTQTQVLVQEDAKDELHKILKMRGRPKVLLVDNYEDAVKKLNQFRRNILCVISDVRFSKNGVVDENAGVELIMHIKKTMKYPIPTVLQSTEIENATRAKNMGSEFINKNSESLAIDILNFMYRSLGFGNFVFKGLDGRPLGEAENLLDFQNKFKELPAEALLYHGKRNSFSTWLMARGEINMAEQLRPVKMEDFQSAEDMREFCLRIFHNVRKERMKGTIINFEPLFANSNRLIHRLAKGSLGGKGRGLAFISNVIENVAFKDIIPDINIRIPVTAIIGALEFDKFVENNDLYDEIYSVKNYNSIKKLFLDSDFDESLKFKLREFLEHINCPIAVRSSGLFEDSLIQPFSGVYATYLIPNNHENIEARCEQLETAIKLVYASIFSETAQTYFNAISYKIEEEKMAVIIQEVVGHEYNDKYYPHFSGIAQSYNYYPISYMEPEDGFVISAVGLGMYVVGGEGGFRYSPKYPQINADDVQSRVKNSQRDFYAIDLKNPVIDLDKCGEVAAIKKYSIRDAIDDGTLQHMVSSYMYENDDLLPGVHGKSPIVVDFSSILIYDHIPLAKTISLLLNLFKQAMGAPVEIEYTVDLEPGEHNLPTFYLLQIKPLIRLEDKKEIILDDIEEERILVYTEGGMGNGKITNIQDVVYVDVNKFDKLQTKQMANEINTLNDKLEKEGRDYILIGPGRWGTRDPFTGIPVTWSNISRAKIIIEIGLPNFPLDASLGSHFFHNVTSMNVGYFSIPNKSNVSKLNMKILDEQPLIHETQYIKHVKFNEPLTILMNGKKRKTLIYM